MVATPIAQNVLAFDATGQGIYAIQKNSLAFLQSPTLQPTTLRENLPNWVNARLYVNSQNQIFINADGALYSVSSGLSAIGSNVQTVLFYESYGQVLFATTNEIDLYNVTAGSTQLVARTSATISNPQATLAEGSVFFIGNGELQTIETDSRDHQNSYVLASAGAGAKSPGQGAKSPGQGAKFYVSSDAKYVVLLDGGNLTQLQVR